MLIRAVEDILQARETLQSQFETERKHLLTEKESLVMQIARLEDELREVKRRTEVEHEAFSRERKEVNEN